MVGDHATLVSPAMARAAAPWWGEPRGTDGFFVDEPLPRWVACCCCSSTKIRRAGDANPTKPPCGRHGGVYRGRWSTTTPKPPGREGGGRTLCGGGWPGLARAADLAGSAARPNGGALSSPPVYAARSPRPADARRWVALRSEPGITSARTLRGSEGATPSGRRREEREKREGGEPTRWGGGEGSEAGRKRRGEEGDSPSGRRREEGRERTASSESTRWRGRGGSGAGRAEPRSGRADGNRGSERSAGDARR